ncbi:ribonuclease H-like domain-containing protein [Tanacetum coccineum]
MVLRTVLTRRPFNKITTTNNSNFTKKVNNIKRTRVNTARPKAVLSAVEGNKGNVVKASACWVWRPKHKVLDHVSKNNGASMSFKRFDYIDAHMTGNISYLTDYEEIDGGFVAFGGNSKGGKITRKGIKNLIDLRVKVIRCDNGTEFKNRVMNQFCEIKGRKLALSFMRPFGCPVTILNTIDHLGKFDGKADEGFFVGYSTNSKAFRVFNSSTRIVEENLHVQFSENTSNGSKSGPNWLFDIDALTNSMNHKPVVARNQSNGNAGTKAYDDAGKARMEIVPGKDYILQPMWLADPLFSQNSKESPDARFKPSGEEEKMDTKDLWNANEALRKDNEVPSTEDPREDQRVNQDSNVNAAVTEVNVVDPKTSIELPNDLNMPELEDIVYSDDEDVGAEAYMNNLDAFMPVSPIPTTRIHKDHLVDQIIRDLNSAP